MRSRIQAICAALLVAAPIVAADVDVKLIDSVLADRRAANFLGVKADTPFAFDHSERVEAGDLDGDGTNDHAVVLRKGGAAVVAAFLTGTDGASTYAGSVRVDVDANPTVVAADVTGNGKAELCIEFSRGAEGRAKVSGVVYAGVSTGKLTELFRGLRDEVERTGSHTRRATHTLRFDDADGDGLNELEVTSEVAELLGPAGEERLVEGTVIRTSVIYTLKAGSYEVLRLQRVMASPEKQLEAAMEMLDAGIVDRATQITADLGDKALADAPISERSATILGDSRTPAPWVPTKVAPSEVAKPADPSAPATT